MTASKVVFLYVTFPATFDVAALAEVMLTNRLIACVNVFSMRSVYRWEGKTASDAEQVAIFKTARDKEGAVREFLAVHHPYKVPCIATVTLGAINEAFAEWVQNEVRVP